MLCKKVRESFLWSVNFHQKRIAMKNERQKNSNETKFKMTRFYSTFFGAETTPSASFCKQGLCPGEIFRSSGCRSMMDGIATGLTKPIPRRYHGLLIGMELRSCCSLLVHSLIDRITDYLIQ